MAAQEPSITGAAQSRNQACFILRALVDDVRQDGRSFLDFRSLKISFDRSDGRASAEVQLGGTRVLAEVVASVTEPYPDRPLEGFLLFNVELTSIASGAIEPGRTSVVATEIARMLERQIRDARAVDVEALCIRPAEKVWAIRCDTRVLEDDGNLIDASALATMAALLHFRRADVSLHGDNVIVHSYSERSPVPLSIHHVPLCVTFGLFAVTAFAPLAAAVSAGQYPPPPDNLPSAPSAPVVVLDPRKSEEEVGSGSATFVVNAHKELCGIHKLGGCPLPPLAVVRCAKVASDKAAQLVSLLREALVAAEAQAAEKARARHAAAAGIMPQGLLTPVPQALLMGSSTAQAGHGVGILSKGGKDLRIAQDEGQEGLGDPEAGAGAGASSGPR